MPDLSSLSDNLVGTYFFNRIFRDKGFEPSDGRGRAFFITLIRLVGKTLHEYEEARKHLQDYVDCRKKSLLLRCADHMETCIDSLHRLFKYAATLRDRLRTLRKKTGQPVPPIDWGKVPKKREMKRVKEIRSAIRHMDKEMIEGRVGPGAGPIGLRVMSDSIELDAQVIYYSELASWIRQVREVAEQLVTYNPPSS
jgi:hypothetical protein